MKVGSMLQICIPCAGRGFRFEKAGYLEPKPLINILGIPMLQYVIRNLLLDYDCNFIFLVRQEHQDNFNICDKIDKCLEDEIKTRGKNCRFCTQTSFIMVPEITDGCACTVLLAKDLFKDQPLIVAGCDQYIEGFDLNEWLNHGYNLDGSLVTFYGDNHPKWSYTRIGGNGLVTQVAEKNPISSHVNTGIYYFSNGSDYIKYAERMIAANDKVNSEFYLCPVYNYYIRDNKRIGIFPVGNMVPLGTPEDVKTYINKFPQNLVMDTI